MEQIYVLSTMLPSDFPYTMQFSRKSLLKFLKLQFFAIFIKVLKHFSIRKSILSLMLILRSSIAYNSIIQRNSFFALDEMRKRFCCV